MIPAIFVIDTSYLLELFNVPGCSRDDAVKEIRKRHERAIKNGSRLFVPLPCIFELANHIAHVNDGNFRKKLGDALFKTVKSSVEESIPWNVTPSTGIEELSELCKVFSENYIIQGIGLTDTFIIQESQRLKKKYRDSSFKIHIWAKDKALKAWEPDPEENPFLG